MVGHLSNNIIEERTSIPSVLLRREQMNPSSSAIPSSASLTPTPTKTVIPTKTTAATGAGAGDRSVLKFQLHLLPRDDLEEPTSFLSFCPYTNIIAEGSTEDDATNAWIEKASEAFSCAIILGHSSFTTKKVICGVVPSSSVPVYVIIDDQRKKHVLGPLETARLGLSASDDDDDDDSDGENEEDDGVLDRHEESGMRSGSGMKSGSGGVPKREDGLRSSMDEVGMLVDWRVSCTTVIAYPLSLRPYYSPSPSSSISPSSSCSSSPSSSSSSSGSAPALNSLGIPRFGLTPHYIN
eukprot:TRINITY_DN852_c0_g1_i1.p1 TRINITY_DN852_c0_g1~~TRINITY_DN852_c0_g1_i1.p1  ORF type:complete len:344 (+),score=128.35 TRINITY_DN852_c0_g1_i1:150-1034(+)